MSLSKLTLTVLFLALLAACGGGSPASKSDTPDTDGGEGSGVSPDPVDPTDPIISNIGFGSGIGQDFLPGKITLESNYSLVAGALQVSVDVVDSDNANDAVAQAYQFEFSSICSKKTPAQASFSVPKFGSTTGSGATIYRNIGCLNSDTITVKLISQDGKKQLGTATAVVPAYVPQLGFGSGAEYVDGKISGESVLLNKTSSILTANAVDIANINELISAEHYTAVWKSSCVHSKFSVTSQTLSSGNLVTRYNANSCVGVDVVTLTVYATNNLQAPLDSISMSMQVGPVVDNSAVPALSELTLSNEYVLAGNSLSVNVKGIDSNNNSLLTGDYKYQFLTSCTENTSSFKSEFIAVSSGEASNILNNKNCVSDDAITLTVNLFESNADVASDAALDTLTITFNTAYPKLGFGSGADFVAGKIDGITNLIDEASTMLTVNAVDETNLNSLINSDNYVAQWSAACAEATFSINSQSLSTSKIVTRYDANSCAGNDTVTVKLFAKNDSTPLSTATVAISIAATANISIVPKLGAGSGRDFNLGQLDVSANYVLAGGDLIIGVNGVNSLASNALLQGTYLYKFESSCTAGTTRFSSDVVASAIGQVTNTYFNGTCSGGDTITVSLYAASANTDTDQPLSTATASIGTALPKLGFGSGSDFFVGIISGNANLVDEASTKLSATVVDPSNANTELTNSDYYITWKDDCASDQSAFSIVTQNISRTIETRYDADAVACKNPQVTLELFNKFDEVLDSINIDLTIAEGLEPEEPLLGTGLTTNFVPRAIELSESPISARQTVGITVNIVDGKDGANTLLNNAEYAVSFDSICAADGRAVFDVTDKRTTSGQVTVYYTASGCTGDDRINATLYAVENNTILTNSLAVATTVLTINRPAINSIEYQGMTTRQIAMKGISFSDLPEVTAVTFLIKDEYNNPSSGKKVFFTLSNPSVDATLSGIENSNGEVEVTTNAAGLATAFVNSGSTHGLVSVKAEITRKNYASDEDALELADVDRIRTQSFGISITTGLPVQSSFSMVADTYNPRGWNVVGEEVKVTVKLSDHFQNPVPAGTRVNFVADGGQIQASCDTVAESGSCFVTWTSAKPLPGFNKDNDPLTKQKNNQKNLDGSDQIHPTNDPSSRFYFNRVSGTENDLKCGDGSPEQDAGDVCFAHRLVDEDSAWNGGRSGVVTILAYTQGEVGFTDGIVPQGNGRFDNGESFSPMAEAYLDANEDGKYTAPDVNNPYEELIEFDNNGAYTLAPTTYQGGNCSDSARANGHCAEPVHIRQSIQLIMASDNVHVQLESATGENSGDLDITQCINVYNEKSVEFKFSVSDYNGNTPIRGTNLTFTVDKFTTVKAPEVVGNSNNTYAHTAFLTVQPGDEYSNTIARLYAAHPDDGEAGFAETPELSDDPRIKTLTSDYLLNTSAGAQILAFQFEDGCGHPPQDSDVIIFEATGLNVTTFNNSAVITVDPVTNVKTFEGDAAEKANASKLRTDYFQIYGKELSANGEIFLEIERAVSAADVIAAEGKTLEAIKERDSTQIKYDSAKSIADADLAGYLEAQKKSDTEGLNVAKKEAELAELKANEPDNTAGIAAAEAAVTAAKAVKKTADDAVLAADAKKLASEAKLVIAKTAFDLATNLAETTENEEADIKTAAALKKGSIKIRAVNRAADGLETSKDFEVRL